LGTSGSIKLYEVEKGAIRRFADAVDDANRCSYDEEYARNSKYGSNHCAARLFRVAAKTQTEASPLTADIRMSLKRLLRGRLSIIPCP